MATHLTFSKAAIVGSSTRAPPRIQCASRFDVRTENVTRREGLLGVVVGVGTLLTADASLAAYGDAANVFGKQTDTSGFIPYAGEGFAVKIPSKWNPSLERDFDGVSVRYEDNQDAVTNFVVIEKKTDKRSITDFGSPSDFLGSVVGPLLGQQVFTGETISEGGFAKNKVSAASLLDDEVTKDKNGKQYYTYEILTRSADGDEGGRHQLFAASVSEGKLLILKAQCGDKRWFKGAAKDVRELVNSFTVA